LNFHYSEWDPPYERIPLADKVAELAQDYPYLTSLKSAQLSITFQLAICSMVSYLPHPISWKPQGDLRMFSDLHHSISSVFQDKIVHCHSGSRRRVAVSPFGLQDATREAAALDIRQQQQQQVIRSSLRGSIFLAEASRSTPSRLQLLHVSITPVLCGYWSQRKYQKFVMNAYQLEVPKR